MAEIRNMTEEELRRSRASQREPSDPLAWGPEKGVEEDEISWDLLTSLPVGKIASRLAGRFRKMGVKAAERKAAEIVSESVKDAAPKAAKGVVPLAEDPKWIDVGAGASHTNVEEKLTPEVVTRYSRTFNYQIPEIPSKRTYGEEIAERVMNGLEWDVTIDPLMKKSNRGNIERYLKPRWEALQSGRATPLDKLRFAEAYDSLSAGLEAEPWSKLDRLMSNNASMDEVLETYGLDYLPDSIERDATKAFNDLKSLYNRQSPEVSRALQQERSRAVFNLDQLMRGNRGGVRVIREAPPATASVATPRQKSLLSRQELERQSEEAEAATIREAMKRNQEGIRPGEKLTAADIYGRPTPDFITDRIPIEHNGETFWLDLRSGSVYPTKLERQPMYSTGAGWTTSPVKATDYTFYTSDKYNTKTNPELKGLAAKVREKLSEVHGNILSDRRGASSTLAQKSWAKTPGSIDIRNIPREAGATDASDNLSKYLLKHPTGGNIRGIIEDLKRRGFGQHIEEEDVAAYLKYYGGNALVGAAGLAGFQKYLNDKDK